MEFYIAHQVCNLRVEMQDSEVVRITFVEELPSQAESQELSSPMLWPYTELLEYLDGKRKTFTFPYQLHVTPFERRVYQGLLNIPYGTVSSYKDIAIGASSPKGFRAVGQAAHKNPLPILIPCHRVIGTNHTLTGFAGGLGVKERLLQLEGYFLT